MNRKRALIALLAFTLAVASLFAFTATMGQSQRELAASGELTSPQERIVARPLDSHPSSPESAAASRATTNNAAQATMGQSQGEITISGELVSPQGRIVVRQVDGYSPPPESATTSIHAAQEAKPFVYTPSFVPQGMALAQERLLTPNSVGLLFNYHHDVLQVVHAPAVEETVMTGHVEPLEIGGRPAFVISGRWDWLGNGDPDWLAEQGLTLLIEVDEGAIRLSTDGDQLTKQDLTRIAESLERDDKLLTSLLDANQPGNRPHGVSDGFGPLYTPTHIPLGYEFMFSKFVPVMQSVQQFYIYYCGLYIEQYALGSDIGEEVKRRATYGPHISIYSGNTVLKGYQAVTDPQSGILFYVSDAPSDRLFTAKDHWFLRNGVWFDISFSYSPSCSGVELGVIGKIAASLEQTG